MDLKQLETFIAAVRSESFLTPTGDHHRYDSSAHPDILALEEELGVLLFIREGTNSGILTDSDLIQFILQQFFLIPDINIILQIKEIAVRHTKVLTQP